MKLIYEGWAGIKLAPDLAVDDVTESPSFGWLYAKHPDGQWVTLADLKPIFPSPDKLRAENTQMKGELAAKQAELDALRETAQIMLNLSWECVERYRSALQQMVDEKVDYMRRNNLGDPEKTHTIICARDALRTAPKFDGQKKSAAKRQEG